MAKSRESFERRQRERAKKAKADAKRERRLSHDPENPGGPPGPEAQPRVDENEVIGKLAELHAAFDNHEISFDDFETRRRELLTELRVD
jgi:hypothetical protein